MADIAAFLSAHSAAPRGQPPPSPPRPAVSVLLGHDATLLSLLAALPGCRWGGPGGAEPSGWPPTGANIRFELWEEEAAAPAPPPSPARGGGGGALGRGPALVRIVYQGKPLWIPAVAGGDGRGREDAASGEQGRRSTGGGQGGGGGGRSSSSCFVPVPDLLRWLADESGVIGGGLSSRL